MWSCITKGDLKNEKPCGKANGCSNRLQVKKTFGKSDQIREYRLPQTFSSMICDRE
jgi:hypothetical protein